MQIDPAPLWYRGLRTALFALPPETAHRLTLNAIRSLGTLGPAQPCAGSTPRRLLGLEFANPVGLAAGWDKDGEALAGLSHIGFGFVEVGTVTPRPQPGNPKPRMFRLPEEQALINRLGFNNGGAARLAERVRRFRERYPTTNLRIGINIGKNRDTAVEDAASDYLAAFNAVVDCADYVTVNLSSPNTPGLRSLQSREALRALLAPLKERQQAVSGGTRIKRPLVVKVAPDLDADEMDAIAEELLAAEVEGLIATNTTITRPVGPHPLADQAGGLSGRPLKPLSAKTVAGFSDRLEGRIPIIGVGGVSSAADGQALLAAGASLLQLYTGFIYQGPTLVRALARL
ncbi:MAG: quinone-dependent dihydroorotate dehydrogenase [Pseudomonadota bacterium]